MKKLLEKESDIQGAVCEYLEYKKHFFFRSNNIPVYMPDKHIFRAMPKYAPKGLPDIQVLTKEGFSVFLEVKRKGSYQSPDQKEFEAKCKERGIEYYVVRSISDVIKIGL